MQGVCFGRHRGLNSLLLRKSSNISSLGPAHFSENGFLPNEKGHWLFRSNVPHDPGDSCQLMLSAERRAHCSAN